MRNKKTEELYTEQVFDQHSFFQLLIDSERDKLIKSLNNGIPFFYQWMNRSLNTKQQELIKKDLTTSFLEEWEENQLLHFPKSILEALYQAAKEALTGEYEEEASHLFYLLTHFLPHTYDVWLGLGLAYQKIFQHGLAIQAFEQAKRIHPQRFYPYLYQAESYLLLDDCLLCQKLSLEAQQLMAQQDEKFFINSAELLNQCALRIKR